jgi:hypothetical protein
MLFGDLAIRGFAENAGAAAIHRAPGYPLRTPLGSSAQICLDDRMNNDESADTGEETAQEQGDKAALDDKGALKPCEVCGGEFAAFPGRAFIQSVEEDGTYTPATGLEVVKSMCTNCGLLRLHVAELLFFEDDEDAG